MATPATQKVIIIGAGPAGLTAAIYSGRAGLHPLVVAGSVQGQLIPGGQLMVTTEVENFPGFPEGIEGPDLMQRMKDQALKFGATIVEEWATEFKLPPGGPFNVKVGQTWYVTQTLILCNGAAAKFLGVPGEENWLNRGISGCATCDAPLPIYRNKHIFVVGGGDSAMEEALFITRFASKVTVVHRRDKLRASKIMAERALKHPKMDFMWNSAITGYRGTSKLEAVQVKNLVTGEEKVVECAGLFVAIGHTPLTKPLQGTGLAMNDEGYIKVQGNIFTNIDGVFAGGDVHDATYKQAISAAGFGCMAAIAAERWLEGREAKL